MFETKYLRSISRLLIVTVTAMALQPLTAAAQMKNAAPQAMSVGPATAGDRYAGHLADFEETLKGAAPQSYFKNRTPLDAGTLKSKVKALRTQAQQLQQDEAAAEAEFDAVAQHIQDAKLPAEILARHTAAMAEYQARKATYKALMQKVANADDQGQDLQAPIADLANFMTQHPNSKPYQKTDPNKLPFNTPSNKVRAPYESQLQYQLHARMFNQQPIQVASAGSLSGLGLPSTTLSATPTADDLAPTEDAPLTPAIRAKAQELGNHPVAIHTWVRNNIEFLPSYGSIQGAELTLQTKRGNDFDTASLEIALLRAAGIPARYVYGTIDLPADKVMNWVGGVTTPEAAQSLLGQGGIPNVALISGGKVSSIRLEHVWVEAWVKYIPSRGAKHVTGQGDAWVPLDASYKQYAYTAGMDLKSQVPLDAQTLLDQAKSGATVNEQEGWVQNLNQANLNTALGAYQTQLKTYIDSQNANATVGDVLGTKTIKPEIFSILMGTLPYKTVATGAKFDQVPVNLQWRIKLHLYTSEYDKGTQSTALTIPLPLSQIGTRRLAAVYAPATPTDAQTMASYADARQLPAYLVNLKLAIQLDDQVLAEYAAQRMGSDQYWTYTLSIPGVGDIEEDFKLASAVGDQIVFGVDGNGLSAEQIANRYRAVNPNTPLENLHHLSLGYWARADLSDALLAQTSQVVTYRQPSVGMFVQPLSVQYWWGIPRLGSYKSYNIDIRRLTSSATTLSGGFANEFQSRSGMQNSYLEGRVFEEVFDDASGIGYSAIAVLAQAIANGTPVWQVGADNLATYLSVATLSATVKDQIANAVSAGLQVIAPQAIADADFWQAEGYVATDPTTGAGAYIVKGANGGEIQDCEEKSQPLTKSISDQIMTFMVLAMVAAILAGGTMGSGGAGAPVAASVLAYAMRLMGVTALVWSSTSYAAGKCDQINCHRGRFQAQGGTGAIYAEESVKWEEPMPLTKVGAYSLLEQLKAKLTPRQLEARLTGFTQMEQLIQSRGPEGVCAQYKNSKPQPPLPDGVRVDIEVNTGQALTN